MSGRLTALEQRIGWTRGFRCAADQTVLKALARWYCWRGDGTNVRPTSLQELAAKSGVPPRSVDRALRRLVSGGWLEVTIRRFNDTATYRICVERLATSDPESIAMVTDQTEDSARHSGVVTDGQHARVARSNEFSAPQWRADGKVIDENRPDLANVARSDPEVRTEAEEEVRTASSPSVVCTSQSSARHSGVLESTVAAFFAWWTMTYPQYHHGAHCTLDRKHDTIVVQDLLHGRTLERLQAMTILLWTITADGNPDSARSWIASGDRNIRVMRRKAAYLDELAALDGVAQQQVLFGPVEVVQVSAREIEDARALRHKLYGRCPHEPKCATYADCVLAIARERKITAS